MTQNNSVNIKALLLGFLTFMGVKVVCAVVITILLVIPIILKGASANEIDEMSAKLEQPPMLIASLVVGFVSMMVGGFVAGLIAKQRHVLHGALVGALGTLITLPFWYFGEPLPVWFNVLSYVGEVPFGILGGFFARLGQIKTQNIEQVPEPFGNVVYAGANTMDQGGAEEQKRQNRHPPVFHPPVFEFSKFRYLWLALLLYVICLAVITGTRQVPDTYDNPEVAGDNKDNEDNKDNKENKANEDNKAQAEADFKKAQESGDKGNQPKTEADLNKVRELVYKAMEARKAAAGSKKTRVFKVYVPKLPPRPNRVNRKDDIAAIAYFKELGGKVKLERTGGPVIKLSLDKTGITDAGLIHLKGLPNLQEVDLTKTEITDEGLVHLKGLTNLRVLWLNYTKITDEGLVHLKGLTNLRDLNLGVHTITDAGLVHLKGLTKLQKLVLDGTKITDAGLEQLKGLTKLKELRFNSTKITDAGLDHLKGLSNLEVLIVRYTRITDAGLVHLEGLTKLRYLNFNSTKVTKAGIKKLQRALPNCHISQ